jgi:hypothetical protein
MGETKASCDFGQKSCLNGVDSIWDISPFSFKPKATTEILAAHLSLMPFSHAFLSKKTKCLDMSEDPIPSKRLWTASKLAITPEMREEVIPT